MTIELTLEVITLIFIVIGGVFGLIQWNTGNRIKRAEFIAELINKLRFDEDNSKMAYLIEYDKKWYNEDFHDGPIEFKMDKLLSTLNHICYLKRKKLIRKSDFNDFSYHQRKIVVSRYRTQIFLYETYFTFRIF